VSVAGLILAAGESRRMGFPKALLTLRGETFVDHLVQCFSRHCWPVVVTLGGDADRIRQGMRASANAVMLYNPDWRLGQITSMQCGLRAVPADSEGVLFTLVDHPNVQPATILALLADTSAKLAVPRFAGRRGHPIYFSRELIPEFLALPASGAARDIVNRNATAIRYVDVEDPGILDDVDDPETYKRLVTAEQS